MIPDIRRRFAFVSYYFLYYNNIIIQGNIISYNIILVTSNYSNIKVGYYPISSELLNSKYDLGTFNKWLKKRLVERIVYTNTEKLVDIP